MQLNLRAARPTPHGSSPLVLAMPAWSVKTRRAPSRHCRDARVYGCTTTTMHDMSTPCPRSFFRLFTQLYPSYVTEGLRQALEAFESRMPGFVCDEALLHGVETRTSSPVQVTIVVRLYDTAPENNLIDSLDAVIRTQKNSASTAVLS